MSRRQYTLLLGLVLMPACMTYETSLLRARVDASRDAEGDAALASDDASPSDVFLPEQPDVAADVVVLDTGADVRSEADARDAADAAVDDAADERSERDAAAEGGPSDGGSQDAVDGPPIDGARDAVADSIVADSTTVGCTVDFTVSGVQWTPSETGADGGSGPKTVYLVGDVVALGTWMPAAGVPMTEKSAGTWSVSIVLADGLSIQFKFVKVESGLGPEWEQWNPFNSNRSMRIVCSGEGGAAGADEGGAADAGHPIVGKSYAGVFGVRPSDATE